MMVERLRRKFIILSVSAVFTVVFAIGFFSNVFTYLQIGRNADELLNVLAENDGLFPISEFHDFPYPLPPKMSPETPFSTRFFTVKMDRSNTLIAVDTGKISSITNGQALAYANRIMQSERKNGYLDSYKYIVEQKGYGSLLVFVNVERDLKMFYSFLLASSTIGAIVILAVFIIVLIFSRKAIAPIAESYEKQKQFITDAGHELKTPLAIINANTEVLEIQHGESQWIESIFNQVHRLSNLIESLVSLTRMDEDTYLLKVKEFSLSALVAETAEQFREMSIAYDKDLVVEVENTCNYSGNAQSISQLVSILIDNALKYGTKGRPIHLRVQKQGKRYILQTINEAGALHKGSYAILFERFYRADSSRNSNCEGYGIGLSVAKAIVLKHKGKISAESPDGKTLVFTVQL